LSERSLILIKPDGVRRGLIGEVISRIEGKGLRITALELRTLQRSVAEEHYAEHQGKVFYAPLVDFITSGPLVAAVIEGPRVIESFRAMAGATDPIRAVPGTIRGDHALEMKENIVHGQTPRKRPKAGSRSSFRTSFRLPGPGHEEHRPAHGPGGAEHGPAIG
jgi:nucleoside-diphosphate kinase